MFFMFFVLPVLFAVFMLAVVVSVLRDAIKLIGAMIYNFTVFFLITRAWLRGRRARRLAMSKEVISSPPQLPLSCMTHRWP